MPLSVKYIKIKVTCEGVKDPVNVTIKQYPLEYIQGIAGWYSTKDELNTYTTSILWGKYIQELQLVLIGKKIEIYIRKKKDLKMTISLQK